MKKNLSLPFLVALLFLSCNPVWSEDNRFDGVEITSIQLSPGIHMLRGAGGNMGVSAGKDGLLLIDDQYAPLAEKIAAELGRLGSRTPDYILNTHFHGDHVGGNEFFGNSSTIIAHNKVRTRLLAGETALPGLPVITYDSSISIYFNNDEIQIIHLPGGHTDGDSMVLFTRANIMHLGDHFWNGLFPFVDLDSGGNLQQYIANLGKALDLSNDRTRFIPGHGDLGSRLDVENFRDMLVKTSNIVKKKMISGQDLAEIKSMGLGEEWDAWGKGFINEDRWIETIFRSHTE